MIQRLIDIKTDATAAFEKDSKQLLARLDDQFLLLALADKRNGAWQAAEIVSVDKTDWSNDNLAKELKQKSTLIGYTGLSTQVFLSTPAAIAIPKKLEGSTELFLKTQFGLREGVQSFTDQVNEDVVIGYIADEAQLSIINKLFPQASVTSTLSLLLKRAFAEKSKKSFCLYLHVSKAMAEVVVMQNGSFALARCFYFTAPEDLLYHMLNLAQQFGVAPINVYIQLQGQIVESETTYQLLEKYFTHIHFTEDTSAIRHKAFWQVPPHFFTGLIAVP